MQIYYQYLLNYKNIINVCIQLILEVYTSYTRNWYKYCILLNFVCFLLSLTVNSSYKYIFFKQHDVTLYLKKNEIIK